MTEIEIFAVGLAVVLLLFFIAMEMQVAFALGLAGAAGIIALEGPSYAATTIGTIPYNATSSYTLIVIPAFVLMGLFASNSGMLTGIFSLAQRLLARVQGGLGAAASLAGVLFGGISGSSVADSATIGRLSIGEMTARGYDRAFAAAVVAAGGTAAILIPPSIALVVFGIITGESIEKLLLAGIVPGIVTAIVEVSLVLFLARRYVTPVDATSDAATAEANDRSASRQDLVIGVLLAMGLMAIVMGGIYTGVFTATEASTVGAAASLVFATTYLIYRKVTRPELGVSILGTLSTSVGEGVRLTSALFMLLVGAAIFSRLVVLAGVPTALTRWVASLDVAPVLILTGFLLILVLLGTVLDGLSLMLLVVPIAYPALTELGYNGILIAVLVVKTIEIGLITPPVGLNVFVVAATHRGLEAEDIFRRITPFVLCDIVVTAVLIAVPSITLWLPQASG